MKRKEAINLLYKIYNACPDITINAIKIRAIKNKKNKSDREFDLIIKSSISKVSQSILTKIAKNHELELSKKDQNTIISSRRKN